MRRILPRSLVVLGGLTVSASLLAAQGALDPSIAPRAARLVAGGDRQGAAELLGRYLATAPDDGGAWLELGRLYLADSRDWHRTGHRDEPDGALFLDFAATALDQSLRLPTDSGFLIRALVEVDRAATLVEDSGWAVARGLAWQSRSVEAPPYVEELGRNLVSSCPLGGVIVTGSDLESVAVWAALFDVPARADLLVVLGPQFGTDSVYRARMETALAVAPDGNPEGALTAAARTRPVCLPASGARSLGTATPLRLVRVAGPAGPESGAPMSIANLLEASYARPNALTAQVISVYHSAARGNPALCASILAPLGARGREACGR